MAEGVGRQRLQLPMIFDVSMGVRRADSALRREIDSILQRRRAEVDALLAEYRLPRADPEWATVNRQNLR